MSGAIVIGAGVLGDAIAKRLGSSGAVAVLEGGVDVTRRDALAAALDRARARVGSLTALVYCVDAGASDPAAEWEAVLGPNLRGAFLGAQLAAPHLAAGGSIVLVGSVAGLGGHGASQAYVTARAALVGLARSLALDLGPRGVRVNLVAAGDPGSARGVPLGRAIRPEDVAASVSFLCSADASFITGQCLSVDGGRTLNQQGF